MKRFLLLLFLIPNVLLAQENTLDDPLTPGAKIAFLGMTFIDTSTEGAYNGVREDEVERIAKMEDLVRERMSAEGFEILDNAPIQSQLESIQNPADCYGCDVRMGEELGADYVLTGEVQKVSNLILSMNLVMRNVPEGKMIRGLSVDVRSNTDDSWAHGVNYIFKHHFFPEE